LVTGQAGLHGSADVAFVWDLSGPPAADPLALRNADVSILLDLTLDSAGRWVGVACNMTGVLWPLGGRKVHVIRGQAPPYIDVAFTPDGKWLASHSGEALRLWPLSPAVASSERTLDLEGGLATTFGDMSIDPDGRHVLVIVREPRRALLVPLDGGTPRALERFSPGAWLESPAISRDGRLAAAGSRWRPEGNLIELWDLRSGEVRTLDPRPTGDEKECGSDPKMQSAVFDVEFTSDGRLLSAGLSGLRLWNLDDGTNTLLRPCADGRLPRLASSSDRFLLLETDWTRKTSLLTFHDLRTGISRELTSHGNALFSVALDPRGEMAVTGGYDGLVRAGPVTGEEPHLLYGHDLQVTSVAVSPDGQWIASGSDDGTIRLWPRPQGRPLQTLPREDLLTRLRSFTNLRVVRDEATETGYRVEAGPFPGWAVQPEW
jgi:WD40 repeat protein